MNACSRPNQLRIYWLIFTLCTINDTLGQLAVRRGANISFYAQGKTDLIYRWLWSLPLCFLSLSKHKPHSATKEGQSWLQGQVVCFFWVPSAWQDSMPFLRVDLQHRYKIGDWANILQNDWQDQILLWCSSKEVENCDQYSDHISSWHECKDLRQENSTSK